MKRNRLKIVVRKLKKLKIILLIRTRLPYCANLLLYLTHCLSQHFFFSRTQLIMKSLFRQVIQVVFTSGIAHLACALRPATGSAVISV